MINLHESMVPGRDRTRDPWICSQTRICNQTRYRLRYAARYWLKQLLILYYGCISIKQHWKCAHHHHLMSWLDNYTLKHYGSKELLCNYLYQSPLILTELFQHNLINVSYLTACYLYQVMMTLHFLNDVANDAESTQK